MGDATGERMTEGEDRGDQRTGRHRRARDRRGTPAGQARPPLGIPERRSGMDRRLHLRRKADRIAREGVARLGRGRGEGGREYARYAVAIPLIYRALNAADRARPAGKGMTQSVGLGGIGVVLAERYDPGTRLEVLLRLGGEMVDADVEVVTVDPALEGFLYHLRFIKLSPTDRTCLKQFLDRQG